MSPLQHYNMTAYYGAPLDPDQEQQIADALAWGRRFELLHANTGKPTKKVGCYLDNTMVYIASSNTNIILNAKFGKIRQKPEPNLTIKKHVNYQLFARGLEEDEVRRTIIHGIRIRSREDRTVFLFNNLYVVGKIEADDSITVITVVRVSPIGNRGFIGKLQSLGERFDCTKDFLVHIIDRTRLRKYCDSIGLPENTMLEIIPEARLWGEIYDPEFPHKIPKTNITEPYISAGIVYDDKYYHSMSDFIPIRDHDYEIAFWLPCERNKPLDPKYGKILRRLGFRNVARHHWQKQEEGRPMVRLGLDMHYYDLDHTWAW